MTNTPPVTLYYVYDPMCSWCWGFRPVWNEVKKNLPADIKLISWLGGLAPDSKEPMAESMSKNLQATWLRIQQTIPGTRFNFDFWTRNNPRRSTYPACRAVIAARILANLDDEMTFGIQQAYYLQARNPSNLETLVEVAEAIGLNENEFKQQMTSPEISQQLNDELGRVHAKGIYSFPCLLIQQGHREQTIKADYLSAGHMLDDIKQFLLT